MAQAVKNLPAMQETRVPLLGQEDPLEKGMGTYSSILAWRIPWTEKPGWLYSPCGHKELDMSEQLTHTRLNFQLFKLVIFVHCTWATVVIITVTSENYLGSIL